MTIWLVFSLTLSNKEMCDMVEAYAMVANFLSRYFQHFSSFVADEDLHGRNVLLLTSLLREVLKVYIPRERRDVCFQYIRMLFST